MFLEFSERITSHEYKEFTHLWSVMSVFHQTFQSERLVNLPTFSHDTSKDVYVSNNDHVSIVKLIRELRCS